MPTGKPEIALGEISAEATVCGVNEFTDEHGKIVKRPEYYVLDAIKAKLDRFPLLRERLGASEVASCDSARRFMKTYRELGKERPEYFAEPAVAETAASPEPAPPRAPAGIEDVASSKEAAHLGSSGERRASRSSRATRRAVRKRLRTGQSASGL